MDNMDIPECLTSSLCCFQKYQTVKTLIQQYVFIPAKYKDCYLVYILNEYAGQSTIGKC